MSDNPFRDDLNRYIDNTISNIINSIYTNHPLFNMLGEHMTPESANVGVSITPVLGMEVMCIAEVDDADCLVDMTGRITAINTRDVTVTFDSEEVQDYSPWNFPRAAWRDYLRPTGDVNTDGLDTVDMPISPTPPIPVPDIHDIVIFIRSDIGDVRLDSLPRAGIIVNYLSESGFYIVSMIINNDSAELVVPQANWESYFKIAIKDYSPGTAVLTRGSNIRDYKEGQIVALTSNDYEDAQSNPRWGGTYGYIWGLVDNVSTGVHVRWSSGRSNGYTYAQLSIITSSILFGAQATPASRKEPVAFFPFIIGKSYRFRIHGHILEAVVKRVIRPSKKRR